MPRKIDITVSPQNTNNLISDLQEMEGLVNLQVLRGASIQPAGDVVSATIVTKSLHRLMLVLDKHELGTPSGPSIQSSEPDSLVDYKHSKQIDRDSVVANWEEMESLISRGSNGNTILLMLMVTSGALAAVGIATNAIHIVIGGMLVAPGFMPFMRITLGLVSNGSSVWKKGLADVFLFYLVMIASAALSAWLIKAFGTQPLPGKADYYELTKSLFSYWTTVTPTGVMASAAASLAGAILIATKRSVFASGVMIGLALVPSAALIGMSLAMGDMTSAGEATVRWLVDVALILGISYIFFAAVKAIRHKRGIAM